MEENKPHVRRKRYSGTHPKKFEEKYKELQPEKYGDMVQHVIDKGNTPAGMHISIMVEEILQFLDIKPGQIGFDATLGYGGHTRAMLERLQGQGHMYATDVDPEESAKTRKRLEEAGYGEDMLSIRLQNFCTIDEKILDLEKICLRSSCKIFAQLMRSQRKSVGLILFWQIWECLLCKSTTLKEAFPLRWMDHLICG